MSNALLAGVAGLSAHQRMLDVSGNNLANVNTTAFKTSRVTFAELLSNTLKQATQPTATLGGTNPQQLGGGVAVATVDRNVNQGALINTGQMLDMAIEGAGYFTLNDGTKEVYTRVGTFAVDSDYYLVDPGSGYRVQRIGSEGESEGFQDPSSNDIFIPYNISLPAKLTTQIGYTRNLSASETEKTTNLLTSGMTLTVGGTIISESDLGSTNLDDLDQYTNEDTLDKITVFGFNRAGTELGSGSGVDIDLYSGGDYISVEDFLNAITDVYDIATVETSKATIANGEIRLEDVDSGYSKTDMRLAFVQGGGTSAFELPEYFAYAAIGGNLTKRTNIDIYDPLGIAHTLSATFVKTDAANTWDLVVTSITGVVKLDDRRINTITFNVEDGSYGGIGGGTPDASSFKMYFGTDPSLRTIAVNMGTVGEFDGLTQFGQASNVAPSGQDGYGSGSLSGMSITPEGIVLGMFTNGIRREIAAIRIATFQNPAGLESVGSNYYVSSSNSGDPAPSKGLSGRAGALRGGQLEKSNVDVAAEFVNLIQAQNGFQANARTIRVANEVLKELTNLVR